MTEMFEGIAELKNTRGRTCRVAYTLNNTQPVLCSIISDQPVFYMDAEETDEVLNEEVLFELENLRMLENEIQNLQREIQSLQRLATESAKNPEARFAEILEDKNTITNHTNEKINSNALSVINELKKSRMANCYLEFADKHGIQIAYSAQVSGVSYERKAGKILINPSMVLPEQIILVSRELRRHWQHRHGALLHPLMFHPDHAVLVNRLQAADLAATMVRIAWELQLAGEKEAWNYIENSAMADLGRAFSREAYLDFRTLNNGMAAAAVVETWFLSERCRIQDKILIRQMLADYKGYVFNARLSSQIVTPTLISALGSVPYGNNYLAKHAQTILQDPIFTEVRDRSNANFLWFIKFEQSYKETEAELQGKSGDYTNHEGEALQTNLNNSTNGSLQSEFNPKSSSSPHVPRTNTARTAEIICFASARSENIEQHKPVDNSGEGRRTRKARGVGKVRIKQGPSAEIVNFTGKSAD